MIMPSPELNLRTLRDLIDKNFSYDELYADLCFSLGFPWGDIGEGKTKRVAVVDLIKYAKRQDNLKDLTSYCQEIRPHIQWEEVTESQSQHIPFTNRKDELYRLTSTSFTTKYSIVHAPQGYGKSTLLDEVFGDYKDRGWLCGFARTTGNSSASNTIQNIADSLCKTLLNKPLSVCVKGSNPGDNLARTLEKELGKALPGSGGLALIIDLDKIPAWDLSPTSPRSPIEQLLGRNGFVSSFMRRLDKIPLRQNRQLKVHIIIAGRSLARIIEEFSELSPKPSSTDYIKLSPFKFEDVQRTVVDYIQNPAEQTELMAAVALNKGCGHPGCIADIIHHFEETRDLHDEFISELQEENREEFNWERHLKETSNHVFDYLRKVIGGTETLYLLSLFRYLDIFVLDEILKVYSAANVREKIDLSDKLTQTFLFNRDRRNVEFITDSIIQKLLIFHCTHNEEHALSTYCSYAKEICKKNISNPEARPLYWASENLYQHLQEYMLSDPDLDKRQKLNEEFSDRILPETIDTLLQRFVKKEDKQYHLRLFVEHLRDGPEQWELRFLCNYCLRGEEYVDEGENAPFNIWIREIERVGIQKINEGVAVSEEKDV
ncbi:MAG: ATP-binding protein [Chloroflexi bacterium]|nr:ATP-binding protein [Chloroflexota bacterium]